MFQKSVAGCAVLVLLAGCAHQHAVPPGAGAAAPEAHPVAGAAPKPEAEATSKPSATAAAPVGSLAPRVSAGGKAPTAKGPGAASGQPQLDLTSLERRLRDTHAIGVFTKLSLKNQVDDLLGEFKAFHQGPATIPLAELRRRFEALLLKVVSLLQDGDAQLAAAVSSSQEAIWAVLVDPVKFAKI
jgi:hypothetical protein